MKKTLITILVLAFILIPSVAFAEEVVGEGIEANEGELKIVSVLEDVQTVSAPITNEAIAPDDIQLISAPVVGEGIEIGEDEVKIVSVDNGHEVVSSPVVGEDIEIGEDEAKIVSVDNNAEKQESVVEDAKVISAPSDNQKYIFMGIGAVIGLLLGLSLGLILKKK